LEKIRATLPLSATQTYHPLLAQQAAEQLNRELELVNDKSSIIKLAKKGIQALARRQLAPSRTRLAAINAQLRAIIKEKDEEARHPTGHALRQQLQKINDAIATALARGRSSTTPVTTQQLNRIAEQMQAHRLQPDRPPEPPLDEEMEEEVDEDEYGGVEDVVEEEDLANDDEVG
jgi:hypothetical protein